jgi:uncharacterized membrane protein
MGDCMKTYMKIFMYFFLMTAIFGMSSIYLRENFQKTFNTLDIMDISRIVLIGIIEIASGLLIIDTFMRFNEISNAKKILLLVIAILSSMVVFLSLISVYL